MRGGGTKGKKEASLLGVLKQSVSLLGDIWDRLFDFVGPFLFSRLIFEGATFEWIGNGGKPRTLPPGSSDMGLKCDF